MCIPVLVVGRQTATLPSTQTQQSQLGANDRSRPVPACMSKCKALRETRSHMQTRVQVDVTDCVSTWQVTGNLLCQQLPCPATHPVQGWLGAAGAGLECGQSSLADHPHQAVPTLLLGAVPSILGPHQLRKTVTWLVKSCQNCRAWYQVDMGGSMQSIQCFQRCCVQPQTAQ